jgi:TonB family protein
MQLISVCQRFAFAAAFILIYSLSPIRAAEPWGKYTGEDEEFSVRMPNPPRLFSNFITAGLGPKIRERIYSTYSNGSVYLVVTYDRTSLKNTLMNFRLHHCMSAEIKEVSQKSLSGFEGKEYSLKFGEVIGTLNIYVTKKRSYAVAVVQAVDNAPLREYFLSTFSLTGDDTSSADPPPESPSLPQINPSNPLSAKELTRKSVVVSKPEPGYTDAARAAGITGRVVLRAVFASSGKVSHIRVVHAVDGLTERAIDAARHLTFIPATKDGQFVSYWMQLEYNFNLY